MVDIMLKLMPFMMPLLWAGIALVAIGVILILVKPLLKSNTSKGITWSAWLVFTLAVFFAAAQVIGNFLELSPSINLGDAKAGEFNLVSFWQIGLAFFVAAVVMKLLASPAKSSAV